MERLRNYIDGKWEDATGAAWKRVENPSTGELIAEVPLSGKPEADRAVAAARRAFPEWSATPVSRRTAVLYRFLGLLREREDSLARTIVRECGKSMADALAETKRAIENVEVACGMPVHQQGTNLIGCAADIDGEVLRLPIGVFAIVAPFNFPAMVPFWFLPYAIVSGNTCVLKCSEQVPCTARQIAELADRAGFPPGVFNLLNGDRAAVDALLDHPHVQGVSFVGSSTVAREVARRCAQTGKRCQALGGAKNHLVVMPDARLDAVVRNLTTSCYGCAGQRCMASSVIVGVGDETYRTLCRSFVEASRRVIVADPSDPALESEPLVMGPVISAAARARILGLIEAGVKEGANLALDGRGLVVKGREKGHFIGPTVFTDVAPGMAIHRTEIFGPVVCMMKAASLDEAIGIINAHEYGNGASIYTQNGFFARRFKLEVQAGMIGINVGIPAPVAYLPFGGSRGSCFSDIKAQGTEGIRFFTEPRIVTERYWPEKG